MSSVLKKADKLNLSLSLSTPVKFLSDMIIVNTDVPVLLDSMFFEIVYFHHCGMITRCCKMESAQKWFSCLYVKLI